MSYVPINEPDPSVDAGHLFPTKDGMGRPIPVNMRGYFQMVSTRGTPLFEPVPWWRRLLRRGVQS